MEAGRIKDTIKKRAVLKKIKKCRKEVSNGAEKNIQTVQLSFLGEDSPCIFTVSDTVSMPMQLLKKGRGCDYIKVQIEDILNRLYAEPAEPVMMTVVIMLPEQTEEACLRFLMDCLVQTAEEKQIEISDVKAECSPDVVNALLLLTILGKKGSQSHFLHGAEAFLPGREIVMINAAGLEGTVMLENAGRELLEQRFSGSFLEHVRNLSLKTGIKNSMELVQTIVSDSEDAGVYCIGRTGVFGALWELASITKKGFSVELGEIPIYQETIELCEFFDVNPYMLRSGGALLIAVKQGRSLVEKCRGYGIKAAVIGSMENHADKLVCNGEERRYLTMPAAVKIGQNQPEGLHWIY